MDSWKKYNVIDHTPKHVRIVIKKQKNKQIGIYNIYSKRFSWMMVIYWLGGSQTISQKRMEIIIKKKSL